MGQPQTKIARKDGTMSEYSHLWIKSWFRALANLIYLSSIAKGDKYGWHLAFNSLPFIISSQRSELRLYHRIIESFYT